eukprot:1243411-Prymnesium_polylepis.1
MSLPHLVAGRLFVFRPLLGVGTQESAAASLCERLRSWCNAGIRRRVRQYTSFPAVLPYWVREVMVEAVVSVAKEGPDRAVRG